MVYLLKEPVIRQEANLHAYWSAGGALVRSTCKNPDWKHERNNLMHYFANVFPEALRLTDQRLIDAWEEYGLMIPGICCNGRNIFPVLQFGSWVGGDRDGHPFVTPEFTASTLRLQHRQAALKMIRQELFQLWPANSVFPGYMNAFPPSIACPDS